MITTFKGQPMKIGDTITIKGKLYSFCGVNDSIWIDTPNGSRYWIRARDIDDHIPAPVVPQAGETWANDDHQVKIVWSDDRHVVYEIVHSRKTPHYKSVSAMVGTRHLKTIKGFLEGRAYNKLSS